MAELDKFDKNRSLFKRNYEKVSKSDYDNLSVKNKQRYDFGNAKGLVVARKKDSSLGTITLFDSKTFEMVKPKLSLLKKTKTESSPFREYSADAGMKIPTKRPLLRSQLKKAGRDN
tara:strand:- start:852 stop:1199 length:348 start_codon:yes stop_codon:yes gene_type:complete